MLQLEAISCRGISAGGIARWCMRIAYGIERAKATGGWWQAAEMRDRGSIVASTPSGRREAARLFSAAALSANNCNRRMPRGVNESDVLAKAHLRSMAS